LEGEKGSGRQEPQRLTQSTELDWPAVLVTVRLGAGLAVAAEAAAELALGLAGTAAFLSSEEDELWEACTGR
jgi:hypothetical protein